MKGANQLSEMYDCRWKLLGVFFFWVTLLQNEVIGAWYLIAVCLLAVYHAVNDYFDLIPFVTSCLKLCSFSSSGKALLSTCPFLVMSCSSSDTWNTSCIFHFVDSFSLYACFSTAWRIRKGPKNLFLSFLFLFVLMYLLFSQTLSPGA